MISPWIDEQTIKSKDGFAPRTFWNICHGHTSTIVITKVKGMNEIIGGFNPLAWDKTKDDWIKLLTINDSYKIIPLFIEKESYSNHNNKNLLISIVDYIYIYQR
ncbi:hypothetical protein Glove_19g47 [Diversispora epigaea]|uniref:TLDc domain-containing protein n=1 Tax=Diversispora epigaea TaxID=1348612 RepID=A0A397JM19_9GLOM|nr:hypothetical protein Glove_19g47 [Diversispora epigaea]